MALSPRQALAWVHFSKQSRNRQQLEFLSLVRAAMHGKKQDIDKLVKELSKET